VIERDGKFFPGKAGAQNDLEFPPDDGSAGEGLSANGVDERLIPDLDMQDEEATEKFEMIKRGEVHRGKVALIEDRGFECYSNLRDGLHTPPAQRRMLGMRADIWEVLPAAGAFVMAGFRHNGGEVGAAGDLEVAEDEEFVEGGGIAEDGVGKTFGREGQGDGGFEVGADLLLLAGFFDGLLDDAANFEQFFDGGGGGVFGVGAGHAKA